MARARKTPWKKYSRKIKKYARKLKRYRVPKKKLALKSHSFVERVEDSIPLNNATLNASGNLITTYAKAFKMTDIAQYLTYKDLFDDYVLNKVVAELRYDTYVTDNTYTNQSNPVYPQVLIKTDHNDINVGAENWTTLRESERSRLVQLRPASSRPISHVIKPAIQVKIYSTEESDGYGSKWGQVIRCSDMDLPHFGLKMQVQTQGGDSNINLGKISIMYKYYFTMKNAD